MNKNPNEAKLEELLVDWELARESGHEISAIELCGDSPELAKPLQRQIDLLRVTAWMLVDQASQTDSQIGYPNSNATPDSTRPIHSDTTVSEFVSSLTDSGILSDDQLDRLRQRAADCDSTSAGFLAKTLIDDALLTKYQANVLLKGSKNPLLLDRYIILDSLGSGGMGLVFKALHRSMERIVAIKVLPEYAVNSVEKVKRFQREVKAAAKLTHPNIVTAFDAHERNGTYFLVMEYVDGENLLQSVTEQGPVSIAEAVRITDQVAAGLSAAHQQGMVHRDVKPTNIMLTSEGTPKLLDLGLARTMRVTKNVAEQELTQDGLAMGTASYMSPEQALDAKEADARSDIYSLGCTFYFLLTGRSPFQRDTTVQTIIAHREVAAPSLLDSVDNVPRGVEAIYQQMVAKSPEDRFQSVTELRADLSGTRLLVSDTNQSTEQPSGRRRRFSDGRDRKLDRRWIWPLATVTACCVAIIALGWSVFGRVQGDDLDTVHRDLAKWAIASGGYVIAQTDNGEQELFETSDIPAGEIRVVGLDLYSASEKFSIDPIFKAEDLVVLRLTGVVEIAFEKIAKLASLTELSLQNCQVSDADLGVIATMSGLTSLVVSESDITDEGLDFLTSLPNLVSLDLSYSDISGSGLQSIGSFKKLDELNLSGTSIDDADLQHIPRRLSSLVLAWCDIGDKATEHLKEMQRLQILDLEETNVTEIGIGQLVTIGELSDLNLSGIPMSSEAIRKLNRFPSLTTLGLGGRELSAAHYQAIEELDGILDLDLSQTNIDDDGLLRLLRLKDLESLDVEETEVTPSGIDRFYRRRPDVILYVDEDWQ